MNNSKKSTWNNKPSLKKAQQKYNQKNKGLYIRFTENEINLWTFLQKQKNKSSFIKNLIRDHINKNGK